jgi:2-polyprenyl-3-methyl-5-hydroxy-6-metoxy-1,4-benzoquinol methylase
MPGCPSCGAHEADVVHAHPAWGAHRVVRCRRCDLARTDPQPDDAALLAAYESPHARAHSAPIALLQRGIARAFATRAARGLAPAGGRALDVGCGDGTVLAALAVHGFAATGTELPGHGAASRSGASVVEATDLAALRLPAASQRLVVLRHVLEHVRDPPATLREVRRVLEPAGRLVVAVPNRASWQADATGAAWVHLDLPRHLFHFTPATLSRLVGDAGFVIERATQLSFEHGPYGWVCALVGGGGSDADGRRAPALAAMAALAPAAVLLSVAEALAGRGAVIELAARPAAQRT